jgi:hypothetical protein
MKVTYTDAANWFTQYSSQNMDAEIENLKYAEGRISWVELVQLASIEKFFSRNCGIILQVHY